VSADFWYPIMRRLPVGPPLAGWVTLCFMLIDRHPWGFEEVAAWL